MCDGQYKLDVLVLGVSERLIAQNLELQADNFFELMRLIGAAGMKERALPDIPPRSTCLLSVGRLG